MDVDSSSESNVMSESCKNFANSSAFLAGTVQDSSSPIFTMGGIGNSSPSASDEGDCFFAEDGQFASGYVHSSSSQGGFSLALSVIHCMLFGWTVTGSRSLVFTSDIESLEYSARLHGLMMPVGSCVQELQRALLAHMLMGECFNRRTTELVHGDSQRIDVSTCINISTGFHSAESLSRAMLDYVLSYSERSAHLTLNKLNVLTLSLGLTTKLPRYPSRQDYLAALQDLYDSMSSENILDQCLPTLPRESLLMIGRCHRLDISTCKDMQTLRPQERTSTHSSTQ